MNNLSNIPSVAVKSDLDKIKQTKNESEKYKLNSLSQGPMLKD